MYVYSVLQVQCPGRVSYYSSVFVQCMGCLYGQYCFCVLQCTNNYIVQEKYTCAQWYLLTRWYTAKKKKKKNGIAAMQ